MDLYNEEFLSLIKTFQKHQVRYLIVGGFAVNKYGFKRTTGDVDFYLKDSIENRHSLVEALDEMGYGRFEELLTSPIIAGYCEIMMDNGTYADLMTSIPGLPKENFNEYYDMATIEHVGDIPVRFLHYNHLIINKKATGRNKDLLDIEELEKLNKENKTR
jgi:hypothetical protein